MELAGLQLRVACLFGRRRFVDCQHSDAPTAPHGSHRIFRGFGVIPRWSDSPSGRIAYRSVPGPARSLPRAPLRLHDRHNCQWSCREIRRVVRLRLERVRARVRRLFVALCLWMDDVKTETKKKKKKKKSTKKAGKPHDRKQNNSLDNANRTKTTEDRAKPKTNGLPLDHFRRF